MPGRSDAGQQRARIFGVLFALTFVTSIAGLLVEGFQQSARGSGSAALAAP